MKSSHVALTQHVPTGPLLREHFGFVESELPELGPEEILLRPIAISVDPYLRPCMTGGDNFTWGHPQFQIGQPLSSMGVAQIEASRHAGFPAGMMVQGLMDWADLFVWRKSGGPLGDEGLQPVDAPIAKPSHALGILGHGGLTAYYGIVDVARPRAGESILISGAAGCIGSIAGQVARHLGAKVYGLAGTDEKCRILCEDLKFDGAVNHRSDTLEDDIRAFLPEGPDIYFDNVGGLLTERVMWMMRRRARIVECGQIATYDNAGGFQINAHAIHTNGLNWEGFTTMPYFDWAAGAYAQLAHWMKDGRMIALETERKGLAALPDAMVGIMRGDNIGKMVVTLD